MIGNTLISLLLAVSIINTPLIANVEGFSSSTKVIVPVDNEEALTGPVKVQISDSTLKQVDIPLLVAKLAKKHGVNTKLALDLAYFESKFHPTVENYEGSSATGVYQFIDSTWSDVCVPLGYTNRTNPEDNIECAMHLIGDGDIFHWTADKRTRQMLLDKGYVECAEGVNNCKLSTG